MFRRKVILPHPIGIVIGKKVQLGEGCTIFQNVTIGTKGSSLDGSAYPNIGKKVIVYPSAVIVGGIKIGDNSIIGAGTFVNKDIPERSIAFGNPLVIRENEYLN